MTPRRKMPRAKNEQPDDAAEVAQGLTGNPEWDEILNHRDYGNVEDLDFIQRMFNDPDPMIRIGVSESFIGVARNYMDEAVVDARRAGRTWEQIGTMMRMTKQAVWEYYRNKMPDDLTT